MASLLDTLYQHSPTWVQNLGIASFGYVWRWRRLGGAFTRSVEAFTARDGYSEAQWRDYQRDRLRELLVHAFRTVPYYREVFGNLGLDEAALAAFEREDLVRLPILDKDLIRQRPQDFLAATTSRRKIYGYATSGSTGTPLVIHKSAAVQRLEYAAYEARCRRWAGVDCHMSRAMIGGRMVVPKAASRPPFWRYNPAERQLYFSAFHISPEHTASYVEALNQFQPDFLVGYASSHTFLARMIESQNLTVHRPKAILTSSEKLTEDMRATLERVYRCEVFDGYSGVETCCLASECASHALHLSPDVGVVELLDADGQPVQPGQSGEIVATGLLNFDMPFIRYRTHDLAVASTEPCACGRAMPVLSELVGRLEDTVYGADGRQMVRFHGIFIGIPGIREGQVIQETLTGFRVRVVAPGGLTDDEARLIRTRMATRLGPVDVDLEQVDAIERTARGKFKAVICKLSAEEKERLQR